MKKRIYKISAAFFALCLMGSAYAQTVLHRDSLISDFRCLVELLEKTHPDPYSGFGGRVLFHKEALNLEARLNKNDHTEDQFMKEISVFLSNIQDGHTYVLTKQSSRLPVVFSVDFRVIPNGIILSTLSQEHKNLLGSRVLAVEGIKMEVLLKKIKSVVPCENDYGAYQRFTYAIIRLFSEPKVGNGLLFTLQTPLGEVKDVRFDYISREDASKMKPAILPTWNGCPDAKPLSYQFSDQKKDVMIMKISDIEARENFDYMFNNKWPGAYEQLSYFYQNILKKAIPQDTLKAIQEIPSFSEEFYNMLIQMKKQGSKTLIIDLRDNGGGFTPITLPVLYQLYGDRYLNTDIDAKFFRLISPLYMTKIATTLEDYNRSNGTNYKYGDYFSNENSEDRNSLDIEKKRHNFIQSSMSSDKAKKDMVMQNGKPLYTPERVYVVTNARTFSAAFHFAYYLWRMGAVIVGVPSMQAPNAYMEQTPFKLSYTEIEGSISNSAQYFLPENDPRAKTFWPDVMPSYNDYKKHNFDQHAEILFLLDSLTRK